FFSSRRRHTRCYRDWSSDVCSSDLPPDPAQQQFVEDDTPIRLGPVGGRIVAEVIVGLMIHDSHSYLRQDRNFSPRQEFLSPKGRSEERRVGKEAKSQGERAT